MCCRPCSRTVTARPLPGLSSHVIPEGIVWKQVQAPPSRLPRSVSASTPSARSMCPKLSRNNDRNLAAADHSYLFGFSGMEPGRAHALLRWPQQASRTTARGPLGAGGAVFFLKQIL